MPFILATVCPDVEHAKAQVRKAQAAAYRHDMAWSVYSESPAVQAWIRAYSHNIQYPIFLSGPDTLPPSPAFVGPNAGYNVGLALGFVYEQPVVLLDDAEIVHDAWEKLDGIDAEAIQGACSGQVDDPRFWQASVDETLRSVSAKIVSPSFAVGQLQKALEGNLQADKPWICHDALHIRAASIEEACVPPFGTQPIDLYSNTAYFFRVRVMEPHFAWTHHEPQKPNPDRFNQKWQEKEKTESRLRMLEYLFDKTRMRTVSDFLIDEALGNAYYAPKPAITDEQYQLILTLKNPSLNMAFAKLARKPDLPERVALKRIAKTFFAAQTDWKETLRTFGEQNLDDKLRINKKTDMSNAIVR